MGKRVHSKLNLLSDHSGTIVVLGSAFFLCGLLGIICSNMLESSGAEELSSYLVDYLSSFCPRSGVLIWSVFWKRLCVLTLVVLLGSTLFGVVGLPLVFGAQGFSFGFSVACFVRVFGSAGLFPAFVVCGLPGIVWFPLLFLAGSWGFGAVCEILTQQKVAVNSIYSAGFWLRVCFYVVLLYVCVLLECFAVPELLKSAVRTVL